MSDVFDGSRVAPNRWTLHLSAVRSFRAIIGKGCDAVNVARQIPRGVRVGAVPGAVRADGSDPIHSLAPGGLHSSVAWLC